MSTTRYALTMLAEGLEVSREVTSATAGRIVKVVAEDAVASRDGLVEMNLDADGFHLRSELSTDAAFDVLALLFADAPSALSSTVLPVPSKPVYTINHPSGSKDHAPF